MSTTYTLYGIPNCNTVKKAMDWLNENQITFEFHNFKKSGVTNELINQWFDKFGVEKVINKSGLTFKKLSLEERNQLNSPAAISAYLIENISAIKRPVLMKKNESLLIGFNEDDYQKLLK